MEVEKRMRYSFKCLQGFEHGVFSLVAILGFVTIYKICRQLVLLYSIIFFRRPHSPFSSIETHSSKYFEINKFCKQFASFTFNFQDKNG